MSLKTSIVICCTILFLQGCAYKVPVLRMKSAKMDVAGVRKVGIKATSSGSDKEVKEFASKVQDVLQRKRFFSEVRLLDEDKTSHGKPDAILNIHANKMEVQIKQGTEQHVVEETTGKKIIETYVENGVQKTREVPEKIKRVYEVPYVRKTADVSLTVDFIPSKNQKAATNIVLKDSSRIRAEGNEIKTLMSDDALIQSVSNPLVIRLVDDLIPHVVAEKVSLATNPNCQPGVQLVKQGDWRGARESWEKVVTSNPKNHAAYYNIGVADEALKDYPAAMVAYQKAFILSDRGQYRKALERLQEVLKEDIRLQRQMEGRGL